MFNHDGIPVLNVGVIAAILYLIPILFFFFKHFFCFFQTNLYGTHPFYLALEKSGKSHGVFFHNSNAMGNLILNF